MKQFKVEVSWEGYSRGTTVYIVDAENEDKARANYLGGTVVDHDIIKDDTEADIDSIVEVKNQKDNK